ncbi:MAG: hypothetical protein KJO59_00005, partial [Ignavibacteria bacterium]|nr:hypothetical protein [Ignavibacteria bacterium]
MLIRKICKLYPVNKGSIVIVALHRLGDSVFTIPAIKHIQNHYKSKVTIVCFPHSLPIFQIGLRDVEYCPLESNNFYFDKRVAGLKNKKIFKKIKPKIIYDLTGVMSSASLILTSRAKEINGMSREQFKYIFDNHVLIRNKAHQIDVYLDAISSNIQISKRDKLIQFPVNYNKEDRILIHPLAGWKAKQWGLRKYLMLAKKLKEKYEVYLIA